jgi:hypothetical protein
MIARKMKLNDEDFSILMSLYADGVATFDGSKTRSEIILDRIVADQAYDVLFDLWKTDIPEARGYAIDGICRVLREKKASDIDPGILGAIQDIFIELHDDDRHVNTLLGCKLTKHHKLNELFIHNITLLDPSILIPPAIRACSRVPPKTNRATGIILELVISKNPDPTMEDIVITHAKNAAIGTDFVLKDNIIQSMQNIWDIQLRFTYQDDIIALLQEYLSSARDPAAGMEDREGETENETMLRKNDVDNEKKTLRASIIKLVAIGKLGFRDEIIAFIDEVVDRGDNVLVDVCGAMKDDGEILDHVLNRYQDSKNKYLITSLLAGLVRAGHPSWNSLVQDYFNTTQRVDLRLFDELRSRSLESEDFLVTCLRDGHTSQTQLVLDALASDPALLGQMPMLEAEILSILDAKEWHGMHIEEYRFLLQKQTVFRYIKGARRIDLLDECVKNVDILITYAGKSNWDGAFTDLLDSIATLGEDRHANALETIFNRHDQIQGMFLDGKGTIQDAIARINANKKE